jgi:hypothetical protein
MNRDKISADLVGIHNLGAIVSNSVANGDCIIMWAERSESVDEADSGWQFIGSSENDLDPSLSQIWAIHEVLELEPSLATYLVMPVGTKLKKQYISNSWREVSFTELRDRPE